jgi:hypothetical protein
MRTSSTFQSEQFYISSVQPSMNKISLLTAIVFAFIHQSMGSVWGAGDPRLFAALIVSQKGIGSGCFVQISNSVYLATARHVLFSQPDGTNLPVLLAPSINVKSYSNVGTSNTTERTMTISLTQLMNDGNLRYSSNRDVALVKIEKNIAPEVGQSLPGVAFTSAANGLTILKEEMFIREKDIDVGADTFMFGFPVSVTGPINDIFDPAEPLLRKGAVAGVSLAKKTIIIDSPAYFGNSGGPVIEVDNPNFAVTAFRFIGLVTRLVPFQEEWENKTMGYSHVIKSNSGFTVVEPADSLLDLAWE